MRVGGASLVAIGAQFGISKDSIHRHFKTHVSRERKAALLAGPIRVDELLNKAAAESKSVLEYLQITRGVIFQQFLTAAEVGDRNGVAHIGGRLLDVLRQLGHLTGELREISGLTINQTANIAIMTDPRMLDLQAGLLSIARAHPAARGDIVKLLRSLDGKGEAPALNGAPLAIECEAVGDAA